MIVYLIVCSHVYGGWTCLPAQRMPTPHVCNFIAKQYAALTGDDDLDARCVTIRGKR